MITTFLALLLGIALCGMYGAVLNGYAATGYVDRSDVVIVGVITIILFLFMKAATPRAVGPETAKYNRRGSGAVVIGIVLMILMISRLIAMGIEF